MDIETVGVDYLSLMSKPKNQPRVAFGIRNYFDDHVWYGEHFSFCREHLDEYYAGIERRNQLSRRVSKLHKAYRQKKRGW